jgi:hypothetical protein
VSSSDKRRRAPTFSFALAQTLRLVATASVEKIVSKITYGPFDAEGHTAYEVGDAIASTHIEILSDAEQRRHVTPDEIEERGMVSH